MKYAADTTCVLQQRLVRMRIVKQEFGRRRRDIEQEVAHGADQVLAHQRRGVHVGVVLEVGDVFWHFLFAKKEL